jgi:hypothetical protein
MSKELSIRLLVYFKCVLVNADFEEFFRFNCYYVKIWNCKMKDEFGLIVLMNCSIILHDQRNYYWSMKLRENLGGY